MLFLLASGSSSCGEGHDHNSVDNRIKNFGSGHSESTVKQKNLGRAYSEGNNRTNNVKRV